MATQKSNSSEGGSQPILLLANGSNYETWNDALYHAMRIKYGESASVIVDRKRFEPKQIEAADYTPTVPAGEPAATSEMIASLRLELMRQRQKHMWKLVQEEPKLHGKIYSLLSEESKLKLTADNWWLR